MNVLVTGASGLTGGAVATILAERGHSVVGVARHASEMRAIRMVAADAGDVRTMAPLVAASDVVVHVAGILLGERLAEVPGVDRVRLVVVSSASVHSRHRASAEAYRAGESAILRANPRAAIVRPTMVYGSMRDRNIHYLIAFARRLGFLPVIGNADALLQPIHYEDIAAIVAALVQTDPPDRPIEAGGASPLTLRDTLRAVLRAAGREERLVPIPRRPALALASIVDALRGGRWAERVERLSEDRSVDNAAVITLTGVHPRTFEVGVAAEAASMRRESR